jgi:homopolymeric O-antigen transport system permease protein
MTPILSAIEHQHTRSSAPSMPASPQDIPVPVRVIQPSRGWASLGLAELWRYRELLYFLVWRDVKVRYKQTALGGAWAILQPVITMVVFTVLFGALAKVPSDGFPYPVFVYAGLLPWQLFAHALNESGNSLVLNQQLVKKVYFPRLLIPIAAALAGLVDVAFAVLVLVGMMLYWGIVPTPAIITLPLLLVLAVATATGVGIWLSALNVQYRDVRYTLPFLTQLWFFITPVVYSSTLIPSKWHAVYGLNPMSGVVEGFRWALLGTAPTDPALFACSVIVLVTLLVTGLFYFRRMERSFADLV